MNLRAKRLRLKKLNGEDKDAVGIYVERPGPYFWHVYAECVPILSDFEDEEEAIDRAIEVKTWLASKGPKK